MPNKPRNFVDNCFYHIYNRAVDKRTIFYSDQDFQYFIEKMIFFKEKNSVKILAYCVLPNHWHFLLKSTSQVGSSGISKFISLLSNSYTKHFNLSKDHSGRIFQGPFKSKLVSDDNYLRVLINYINLNALKHKIVKDINDWDYTSHHNYIGKERYNLVDRDCLIDFSEYKKGFKYYIDYLKSIEEEF